MTNRLSLVLLAMLAAATAAAQDRSSAGARRKSFHPIRRLAQGLRAERGAPAATYQALCDRRLAAGPAGRRDPRVDLSAAHALVRRFSVSSVFATGDIALAAALEHDVPLSSGGARSTLARYAEDLDDVCVAHASAAELPRARVVQLGRVAVVRPGTGPVLLAPDTQLEVIDLRDLAASDDLAMALAAAAAPALRTAPIPVRQLMRTHFGSVDELLVPNNIYSTAIGVVAADPLPAAGLRDVPIVLLAGDRIAPQAAAFAAGLRATRRAWLAGADVPLAIAESSWRGVGGAGVAVRTAMTINPNPLQADAFGGAVSQDNPNDPSTAAYVQDFAVPPAAHVLDLQLTGGAGTDLDLYLLYDANGDGTFDFDTELVGSSFSPTANEAITVAGDDLAAGRYRAVVHGYDVPTASTPIRLDVTQSDALPDVIAADLPPSPADALDARALLTAVTRGVPPPVTGVAERAFPVSIDPFGYAHPASQTRGQLRADLVIVHGTVQMFFRYFPIVGDTIDARLVETLTAADRYDGTDRIAFWHVLRRFGEALHDGHNFVYSSTPLFPTRLPVFLEHDGIRPIVRRSKVPGVNRGDTIVALNGRPIEDVYAEELARTSAATVGYQLDIADRYIYTMNGPLTLEVEDTTGTRRSVTAQMQPLSDYNDVVGRQATDRQSGPLTSVGAPDLYYVNLNTFSASPSLVNAAIADASARGARGLILDMRGYPGSVQIYDVAARLVRDPFLSPMFITTAFQGPTHTSVDTGQFTVEPLSAPSYPGPIVLLTGPHAVSAAETFMQMIVGAHRLFAVVGRESAGTNGSMTALNLPGGFGFSFTGMEVRNPDGSRFHGVGILPDIKVPVDARDLANGIDRDLLTAIALF